MKLSMATTPYHQPEMRPVSVLKRLHTFIRLLSGIPLPAYGLLFQVKERDTSQKVHLKYIREMSRYDLV